MRTESSNPKGFWMSDKPLVQQALATDLAELVLTITTTTTSLNFLRGFWETIVREWNGIDRLRSVLILLPPIHILTSKCLRIDKYYMLIRRFVNVGFRLLIRVGWQKNACDEYNDILSSQGGPLWCVFKPKSGSHINPAYELALLTSKSPPSLSYHVADVYCEELEKALATPTTPISTSPPTPLYLIIIPFLSLAAQTPTSSTFKRIQSALFDPLFSALYPTTLPDSEDEDEFRGKKRIRLAPSDENYPNIVGNACYVDPTTEGKVNGRKLKQQLLRAVFDVASQPETRDSNRRKMYALWKGEAEDEDEE